MGYLKGFILGSWIIAQSLSLHAAEAPKTTLSSYDVISTRSMELPQYLTQYLNKNQLQQVVEELNNIRVLTPEQFYVYLRNGLTTVLSASDEALIFKTDLKVTKISLFGILNDPFWNLLLQSVPSDVRESYAFRSSNDSAKIQREIIGQVLWRTYDPLTSPVWMISSDLQALHRDYEYGRTLKEALTHSHFYTQYDSKELWKEVVRLQDLAEKMLIETGLSIDLRSPTNFIVMGDKTSLRISNIDYELIAPNRATRSYYRKQGKVLPQIKAPRLSHRVTTTTTTEHFNRPITSNTNSLDLNLRVAEAFIVPSDILNSREWNLTSEQALDYLQVRHNISRSEALELLVDIPKYKNALLLKPGRCMRFLK